MVSVASLPPLRMNPRDAPKVKVKPVVGGRPEALLTLDEFRQEWPLLRTAFLIAEELLAATAPGSGAEQATGPTFDELLDVTRRYLDTKVFTMESGGLQSDPRDLASATGEDKSARFWRMLFVPPDRQVA